MPTEVKLPRLGQGMDSGKVLRWLKSEGDAVTKGDDLYEVETEKVNMEVEAPVGGTLLKIIVPGGEEVPIGTVLAYLGEPGESVPDALASNGSPTVPPKAATTAPLSGASALQPAGTAPPVAVATPDVSTPVVPSSGHGPSAGERVKASPLARRMARERGVDLATVPGSGPEGRVIARDLAAARAAPVARDEDMERVELTSLRRTIVRRLSEAWQAPSFALTVEVDMVEVASLRARLVDAMQEGDTRPTVSDIIARACALALRRHTDMNSHFAGDAILRFRRVHIGLAVAAPTGLVVPVISDAHLKTIGEIARDRADIVARARGGKLTPSDLEGGTFTISNLGMMGIDEFTAVLNPPMAGILAVGRTRDTVVAVNGRPAVRPRMRMTLSCDHRSVDGAIGAAFLRTLTRHLEDPLTML